MRRLPPALILALLTLAAGVVLLLASRPPEYTLRADQLPVSPVQLTAANACTPVRVLPAETRAVRVSRVAGSSVPPRATLRAGTFSVTSLAPVLRGANVTYPLPSPLRADRLAGQVCFAEASEAGAAALLGQSGPSVALLGADRSSWLAALPLLSERAAFGRGTVLGRAALPLALLCVALACGLLVLLGSRRLGPGRAGSGIDRRAIVVLGLVGTLWGAAYAITTPPFQAPDEATHLRYAQLLIDRQALPRTTTGGVGATPEFGVALDATRALTLPFAPWLRPPWTPAEDRAMDDRLGQQPQVRSTDRYDTASNQPPGYYGVAAAAEAVTGGSLLDRLLVARLVSALLIGLGIAGLAVFVRAAVPSAGGAGVVGVALVACLPLTGFVAGSMNPDALMIAASAWAFALTAIVLRQGLTWRRGLALGAVVGVGVLSKLTFTALLPMFVVAALVVLVRSVRARPAASAPAAPAAPATADGNAIDHTDAAQANVDSTGPLRTALMLVAAVGAAGVVAGPYVLWAVLSGRGLVFGPPGAAPGPTFGIRQWLTYTFGLFVGEVGPIERRLARSGPVDILGDGLVGRLGWLDYGFPRGPMLRILQVWELLALLAAVGIARSARARRAVPVEVLVYAVGVGGLMLVISRAGLVWNLQGLGEFEQARYLFPVAAVGAGGVALALRQFPAGAWRTWVASGVLVAACLHGVMGYLLTIGRYFG